MLISQQCHHLYGIDRRDTCRIMRAGRGSSGRRAMARPRSVSAPSAPSAPSARSALSAAASASTSGGVGNGKFSTCRHGAPPSDYFPIFVLVQLHAGRGFCSLSTCEHLCLMSCSSGLAQPCPYLVNTHGLHNESHALKRRLENLRVGMLRKGVVEVRRGVEPAHARTSSASALALQH